MLEDAKTAVDAALAAGASYADARVNRALLDEVGVRNGKLALANVQEDFGLGVRVLWNGTWGFAAAPIARDSSRRVAADCANRAVAVARALAGSSRRRVELAPEPGHRGEYRTPLEIDPFAVSLAERLELLRAADASMAGKSETVVREAALSLRREEQWHASSEGLAIHQELTRCGAGISTTAVAHGQCERRSYPNSFGGDYLGVGYEHVLAMDLTGHGERVRDESLELCAAPACPPGRRDLILLGSQLMLQIHESVGHPTELDRALGEEIDLAGDSFATVDGLGRLQYGSPIVQLVADSTVAGGLDTRGWDDDGVASKRWHVVRDGVFSGYHTSREWAGAIGEHASRGAARAQGWFHPPIVRITNLSLEPGTWTLEALIADTEDGVLCDTVKTWSIDQRRLNFQFTTEIGWEIRGGARGRVLRSPTYQGRTPDFWNSCDAICDASHWRLWGVPNCGKGNPVQVAEMSHGAAPARFRGVTFVQ
jgi:TldD protein